jgi:hypothetical protein
MTLPAAPVYTHKFTHPLVIYFQGPYWYFEARRPGRGLQPHIAHGNPTSVNIRTNDGLPLVMEVHQRLSSPISIASCREIEVSILDADQRHGRISLGIILSNSDVAGKPSLYLGSDPISSSSADDSTLPSSGRQEVLSFPIPVEGKVHGFNEITGLFLPGTERETLGSKIAIEQFELFPR